METSIFEIVLVGIILLILAMLISVVVMDTREPKTACIEISRQCVRIDHATK